MNRLEKFLLLPLAKKVLVAEAILLLGFSRLAVVLLPFRWIASTLGEEVKTVEEKRSAPDLNEAEIKNIGWAIETCSSHTPWKSNCLAKAIATRFMLGRRKISSVILFGLKKTDEGEIEAHAWVNCHDSTLTGEVFDIESYTIVGIFVS